MFLSLIIILILAPDSVKWGGGPIWGILKYLLIKKAPPSYAGWAPSGIFSFIYIYRSVSLPPTLCFNNTVYLFETNAILVNWIIFIYYRMVYLSLPIPNTTLLLFNINKRSQW
nr:hypothetical protein [Ceratocystis fimbriata]